MDFDIYNNSIRCIMKVGESLESDFKRLENRIKLRLKKSFQLMYFQTQEQKKSDGSRVKKRYYLQNNKSNWGELQIVYWPVAKFRMFYINIISYERNYSVKEKNERKARDNLLLKLR